MNLAGFIRYARGWHVARLGRVREFVVMMLVAGALGPGLGCRSMSEPASASFASVVIPGHSEEEVAEAAVRVFNAAGYSGGGIGGSSMVFEKEATRAQTMSRAGFIGTYEGARTVNRVRTEMVRQPDGSIRLQCRASMVSGNGDAFFDDEVPLTHLRSGPYQSLLRKVQAELK